MTKIKKRENNYSITVNELSNENTVQKSMTILHCDREDLFAAVENIKAGSGLPPEQAEKVALSVRLLGPLMMRERKHPLFSDFMPQFKNFMQHLKGTVKSAIQNA